jgi:hypothetical protein
LLCSEFQLVKSGDGWEDIKPLPCDRWSCGYCAPRRRAALVAQAAAGQPNKMLTLTVAAHVGESPTHRRALLHDAWKRLVKRTLRQFAREPGDRWALTDAARSRRMERLISIADAKTAASACCKLPYMAFIERTKLGEPHLHILLRCPFIPQDWLAEQMRDLIGSPVVWIEQVKGTASAVRYVTKYVGKAPAQFGTAKRYWVSAGWEVGAGDKLPPEPFDMTGVRVQHARWAEEDQNRIRARYWRQNLDDGWVRFWKPGTFGEEGGFHVPSG